MRFIGFGRLWTGLSKSGRVLASDSWIYFRNRRSNILLDSGQIIVIYFSLFLQTGGKDKFHFDLKKYGYTVMAFKNRLHKLGGVRKDNL